MAAGPGKRTGEVIEYGWVGASIIPPIGVIVGIMKIIEKRPLTGWLMIAVGVASFFLWQLVFSL